MANRLLALAILGLAGCSFLGVRTTPRARPGGTPTCESRAAPGLDIAAATGLALAVGLATLDNAGGDRTCAAGTGSDCDDTTTPKILGTVAVVMAVSAAYGFMAVDRCETTLGSSKAR